jgi:hypothetical protein
VRLVLSDIGSQVNSSIFVLPGMNPSIMPEVEAEVNLQRQASSGKKVGGWGRTWTIELISLILIVVLRAGSVGSLLVHGEREGGGVVEWGLGEGSAKYILTPPHRSHHTIPPDQPGPRSISWRQGLHHCHHFAVGCTSYRCRRRGGRPYADDKPW